jgi:cell division protein FtsB
VTRKLLRRWSWLVVPAVLGVVAWAWWASFASLAEARRELAEVEARKADLERTIRVLRTEVAGLERERESRARTARASLDVVAPGEMLVIVPGDE